MENFLNRNMLVSSFLFGVIVGVIFIYVQPLFGMSPLTGRHTELYVASGKFDQSSASVIAWLMHLAVSGLYGVACYFALKISTNIWSISLLTLFLGWFTTVIAPKANAVIAKLITQQSIDDVSKLPPFNFTLDNKLLLHVLFFAVIVITLRLLSAIPRDSIE